MTRKARTPVPSGYTVLLVDDSPEYLEATSQLLRHDGHTLLTAENGPLALEILKQQKVDLLLLDYYMPGMTGEQVISQLRQFNPTVQVILQTGYVNEQPPRELLRRLDIQGYYDKSDGPEKLLLWTDVGLKAAYTLQLLAKSREGLRYILDVTPDMHKIQSLTDLLQGILWQVTGLLGVVNSFLAVLDDSAPQAPADQQTQGFLAMLDDDTELVIRAGTGQFNGQARVSDVMQAETIRSLREIIKQGSIKLIENTTVIPLRIGELTIGLIYLDRPVLQLQDQELLNVFANQAAVAIQNSQLYEMATIDRLTGLYIRAFLEKWLQRELRTAFRSRQPLSLLMLDMDKLKKINDLAGHLAGDQALALAGQIIKQATRNTDFAGRYGGDEFAILLPQTDREGAAVVARRILTWLKEKCITGPAGEIYLQASIGLSTLEPATLKPEELPHPIPAAYFENMGLLMIKTADQALYESKKNGGDQLQNSLPLTWLPLGSVSK